MAKLYMKPKSVQGEITESAPTAPKKKSKTTLTMQKLEQPQAKSGAGASGASAPRKMTVAPFSNGGGQAAVRALGGIRTDGRIMKGVRPDLLGAVQTQPEGKDWEALTRKDSYYKTAQDWKAKLEETEKELTAAEQKLTEAQWARNMTGTAPEGGAEWETEADAAYRRKVNTEADYAQFRVNQLKNQKQQLEKDINTVLWSGRTRAAQEDASFDALAAKGAARRRQTVKERKEKLDAAADGTGPTWGAMPITEQAQNGIDGGTEFDYLTAEELKLYDYFVGKGDTTAAAEYLDQLHETVNKRLGEAKAKEIRDEENPVLRGVGTAMYGVGAGLDSFGGGLQQAFSKERIPTSPMAFGSEYIREDLADTGPKIFGQSLGQIGFDLANTAGNMAPSILASAALGPAAGAATTFASSGGNAYGEALAQGYDQRSARAYGILSGASEAGLQYALGGISALGGKAVNSEVIQSSLDNIKHAVLRIPAKYAVAAAGEMTEEYLQEILNPVFRNLALGENNEFKLVTEEAAYAALLAALSVGVMEGPHIVRENIGPAGRQSQTSAEAPGSALDSRMDVQAIVDTPATPNPVEAQKNAPMERDVSDAGLVAISEREQAQLATGKRNIVASTVKDIVDFAKSALAKKGGQERLYMGVIPDSTARLILEQTGLDVTGYKAILTGDAVQHTLNRHGDPIREQARGQRVVTADDYGMIPQVLANPDSVELADGTDSSGRRVVLFSKQIGDVYVTAQAVTDSRHALTTDTMWIQKRKGHQDTTPDAGSYATSPVLNAQDAPSEGPSISSLPQPAQDVKPENGGMPNGVGAAERGFAGTYDQLQWQTPASGFHPDGERSARQVDVPVHDFDGRNIPKSAATVMEAQATPDSTVEDIQRLIAGGALSFDSITDDAALRRAERTIRQDGYEEALGAWLERAGRGVISKDLVVEGQLLLNSAMNSRATGDVIRILGAYTLMSTTAAQSLQAQRVLKQLTPEWQLYAVQQSLTSFQNDLNQRLGDKAPTIEVDAALYDAFLAAPAGTEARDAALKAIYQNVADQIPASFMDKWNAWRYLSMLGNPRTHIRNIGGNAAFAPVRGVKNALAWGMENTVNLVSKRAGGDGITRTKSVILPLLSRLSKTDGALVKACYRDIENVKPQLLGQGKYAQSAQGQIDQARTIFKLKPLEATRNANSAALDAEDTWFSYPAYAGALAGYLKANGVTAQMMTEGTVDTTVLERARVWAIREAQRATYRDANAISDFIANIGYKGKSKVGKAVNTMVEGVLPFKRTPANILARGLEYSPAGLVKGLTADLYQVKKGRMTAAQAIDNIAAGLTGSGLLALGAWLASIGLVTGGGGDDEEDKMNDLTGGQDYALSLPGGYNVTLDWLAPEALPFFMGVELFNAMSDNKDGGVTLENIEEAALKVADPLMEMSMLQSLQDAIEAVKFSDGGTLLRVAANAGVSYLSQGVPTLFGQVERTMETERGTTYIDRTSGIPKNVQYLLGKSMNKTPGEYQQIPYIDAWGRREETGSPWIRAINNFANPAYVSQKSETAADKEIRRLLDAGQTGVVPKRVPQSQQIGKEHLSGDEYVRFATLKGSTSLRLVTELIGSSQYKAMSDADKAETIQKAYTYAGETAKAAIRPGYELSSSVRRLDRLVKAGAGFAQSVGLADAADANGNNRTTKAELMDYIEANFPRGQWKQIFGAYAGDGEHAWKNPY